jgi:hypothetical protein
MRELLSTAGFAIGGVSAFLTGWYFAALQNKEPRAGVRLMIAAGSLIAGILLLFY